MSAETKAAPRVCRGCGCTETDACLVQPSLLAAVLAAIAVLHRADKALLGVINGGTDGEAKQARDDRGDALEVRRRAAAVAPGA